jgi:hypothetical protein
MLAMKPYLWQFLLVSFTGWINRSQQDAIEYLKEENRVLREQPGDRRICSTDQQRRRLAAKAKVLGRKALTEFADLVIPDTLLRWYRKLVAEKYDGSRHRGPGRPRVRETIRELVLRLSRTALASIPLPAEMIAKNVAFFRFRAWRVSY